jgi:hypothetical protein
MTPALCSGSARQATSILQAWENGDAYRLNAALDRALAPPPAAGFSSAELERTELLQALAGAMRKNFAAARPQPDNGEQMEVCIGLLQHLVAHNL